MNSSESYGGIDVTLVECVPLADFTIRTFNIVKVSYEKKREKDKLANNALDAWFVHSETEKVFLHKIMIVEKSQSFVNQFRFHSM